MKLIKPDEVSVRYPFAVFKMSILYNFIPYVILVPAAIGLFHTYLKKEIPVKGFIIAETVIILFGLIFFPLLRKSFTKANWLVMVDSERVFIKIRSYLNTHLPGHDKHVIELELDELKWIRQIKMKETRQTLKKKVTECHRYVDMCFNDIIPDDIKQAIEEEKIIKDSPEKRVRSKYGDYPVFVKEDDLLRIRFTGIKPSAAKAVEIFGERGVCREKKNYEVRDTTGR